MQKQKMMISAWLDGECSSEEAQECIAAIKKDPELLQYWRYCYSVRDIAKYRHSGVVAHEICEQISSKIDMLPHHSNVIPLARHSTLSGRRWMQMAVAATIAFVAFVFIGNPSVNKLSGVAVVATNEKPVTSTNNSSVAAQGNPSETERSLAALDKRIAVDSQGNMFLVDDREHKKQLLIQRGHLSNYVERVDY